MKDSVNQQGEKSAKKKIKFSLCSKAGLIRTVIYVFVIFIVLLIGGCFMTSMPGKSFNGPLLPLTEDEKTLTESLQSDIEKLAGEIGPHNLMYYDEYMKSCQYIESRLQNIGYKTQREKFAVDGKPCFNIIAEKSSSNSDSEVFVVGAHYDTVFNCPGANDNTSGIAAMLALAERLKDAELNSSIRFVAFANEEPPHFATDNMGSFVHAKGCRERNENIIGMWALETIGYYSSEKNSQQYPPIFKMAYPSEGNFIGFVGNVGSRKLVRKSIKAFRDSAKFPSEGGALPEFIEGVGWSDHCSFWKHGYSALMITDTAPYRYPFYHTMEDTPDKIDYESLSRVVAGLEKALISMLSSEPNE